GGVNEAGAPGPGRVPAGEHLLAGRPSTRPEAVRAAEGQSHPFETALRAARIGRSPLSPSVLSPAWPELRSRRPTGPGPSAGSPPPSAPTPTNAPRPQAAGPPGSAQTR